MHVYTRTTRDTHGRSHQLCPSWDSSLPSSQCDTEWPKWGRKRQGRNRWALQGVQSVFMWLGSSGLQPLES